MSHLSQESLSQAMHWLVNGSTGLSSKCLLATIINGGPVLGGYDSKFHPHDPSDLQRCIGLLNSAPELRNHLHMMKKVSKEWKVLIEHWTELEASYELETGGNKFQKASKTYALMQDLFKSLEESANAN
ncbi:hypothetical protein [Acinetobacter sp.]|uniref:hypothetical protein n=1 Tax=Acinetobacter sp. TaxID=472 RepID=UPI0028AD079E|nr:hypothetical protein [Acinetobacter sp.]